MKYLDEYRQDKYVKILANQIKDICTKPWRIMEVCGGQTHNIVKYGLQQILPDYIELIHGPGCPVCVTPMEIIDKAIFIAKQPNTILCTFGDMLRVPGSEHNLLYSKSKGADVKIVYSPLDVINIAEEFSNKQVVFFAVGFETTAPAIAMLLDVAERKQLQNFSVLVSNVRVPPVLKVLLDDPSCTVDGFLAAGNVCTVMGEQEYYSIVERYKIPIVITGFEPVDILQGIKSCIIQLEQNNFKLENQYKRSVKAQGNQSAQKLLKKVFTVSDSLWRGLGLISNGGLELSSEYQHLDAAKKFMSSKINSKDNKSKLNQCLAGQVLQGKIKPDKCPAFGKQCTPDKPLGAPMVSMEGACHAYYQYNL